MLFQSVQDLFRAAIFIAGIEGQIQHLLGGISHVGGIELLQLLSRCRPYRRRALLPEAQPPGSGRQGAVGELGQSEAYRRQDRAKYDPQIFFSHKHPSRDNLCRKNYAYSKETGWTSHKFCPREYHGMSGSAAQINYRRYSYV